MVSTRVDLIQVPRFRFESGLPFKDDVEFTENTRGAR